jgi:hypothetical protein
MVAHADSMQGWLKAGWVARGGTWWVARGGGWHVVGGMGGGGWHSGNVESALQHELARHELVRLHEPSPRICSTQQ